MVRHGSQIPNESLSAGGIGVEGVPAGPLCLGSLTCLTSAKILDIVGSC